MCGIGGVINPYMDADALTRMVKAQHHRGPDSSGTYISANGKIGLSHNRLSIIDLSADGSQPMHTPDQRLTIVFNGEIYNYIELKTELAGYLFLTKSDTEVILAAYLHWGEACVEHFNGMFAFLLWDEKEQRLFAARDRFGVKPLYFARTASGTLYLASEIKAIRAAGFSSSPDEHTWATYLTTGLYDHSRFTFWKGIEALPAGHCLTWQEGRLQVRCWYDLAEHIPIGSDSRSNQVVEEEYVALLEDSIRLRFRSDVPIGINLSGGLDSSTLLFFVQQVQGSHSDVAAFTFVTGDPDYDETPWVEKMLASTRHPLVVCRLNVEDVPELARTVTLSEDEPFGGLPTLAYSRLFEKAREQGVIVLLDGQGMDEQWAGYDYYRKSVFDEAPIVQGTTDLLVRPNCLVPEFKQLMRPFSPKTPFLDGLLNLQYRDLFYTKIPRGLRFNDRISMRTSTELREPFLDHRLVELALSQPTERKVNKATGKLFLRSLIKPFLPRDLAMMPKRPLQTPQREWLRGPLRTWAEEQIDIATQSKNDWLIPVKVRKEWRKFLAGEGDNSFFIWQWISIGLATNLGWL